MDASKVSDLSIAAMIFGVLFSFALPLVPFFILRKKMKSRFVPLLIGAATFIIFALVLEQIAHRLILTPATMVYMSQNPLVYMLYGGLMAGVFEECGRFVAFKLMRKKYNTSGDALSYGLGHGGVEAVIILGLVMVSNIVMAMMINSGSINSLTGLVPAEQMQAVVNGLVATPPAMFLVGAVERLGAVAFHVGASVLVYLAASKRASLWFFPLAILLHALLDFPAALYQMGVIKEIWVIEAFVLVFAGLVLWFAINRLRAADRRLAAAAAPAEGSL